MQHLYLTNDKHEVDFYVTSKDTFHVEARVLEGEVCPLYTGDNFYKAWEEVMDVLGKDFVLPKELERHL